MTLGLFDRVELSLARQDFDTGVTGAKLGLGEGFTFKQTVAGVKVRLIGDAVYDQDTWLPQVAAAPRSSRTTRTPSSTRSAARATPASTTTPRPPSCCWTRAWW